MKASEVILSNCDRQVLESYKNILDGLEVYLGNGYEIVLHSLESFDNSVIKIVNGHYTGRRIGAPITDLALSMLERISEDGAQEHIAYYTQNKRGEPLKASTIAIKGENNRVIGLLCINFYLNTPFTSILSSFGVLPNNKHFTETFGESTTELIEQAVRQAQAGVQSNPTIPATLKKREIIAQLHAQGIFKIKNAVELIADAMNISRNTVYLHLRHINEGK